MCLGVRTRFGEVVRRHHHRIRRVVTVTAIDGANDRAIVEDTREFRQMFAEPNARQFRRDSPKRTAILDRAVRLRVEGIDLARSACHP